MSRENHKAILMLDIEIPRIEAKMDEICKMINDIPESIQGIAVCSPIRKESYINSLQARFEYLILPEYNHIQDLQAEQRNGR